MSDKVVWRVLPWRTDDAYTNMAIDKTIAESVATGAPPTIRFYKWAGNGVISFGVSQAITDFDTAFCDREGISYVRRFTGGRVMYHSPHDLTYAIAAPLSLYPTRLPLTSDTSQWIMSFLEQLGFSDVKYTGQSSILAAMKKISGSAPHYEAKKAVFQHGSVFYTADYSLLAHIFRVEEAGVRERITTLSEHVHEAVKSIDEVTLQFQKAFLENFLHTFGDLTEQELARVLELRTQYASPEWMNAGKLPLGICTTNWNIYPELRDKIPEKLRARLVEKASE